MQIYQIKNDIAEVLYATSECELFLSDFLFIEDSEQTVISQVINISTTDEVGLNLATARFCISVDKENKLTPYNGRTPAKDSQVGYLETEEILGLFRPKSREIFWGSHIRDSKIKISTDMKFLSSNACVICSKADSSKNIITNILTSLNSNAVKSIVLDFDGKYGVLEAPKKLSYGKDFRIPLDVTALDYIYNNELEGMPVSSKAVIQSIILEIGEYLETLPHGFIPFDTFAQIVEEELKNSKDTGLLIFANKLAQYKQKKLFANNFAQFNCVNDLKVSSVIDISNTDTRFHKLIFSSAVNRISGKYYVFSDITEYNTDNVLIKKLYEKNNIRLIPVCRSDCKYLPKIKQYCNNYVLFAPLGEQEKNEAYNTFVSKLSANDFILYGESTLLIPVLVSMNNYVSEIKENEDEQFQQDVVTIEDLDDLDAIKSASKEKKTSALSDINTEVNNEKTLEIHHEFFGTDSKTPLTNEHIINGLFRTKTEELIENETEQPVTVPEPTAPEITEAVEQNDDEVIEEVTETVQQAQNDDVLQQVQSESVEETPVQQAQSVNNETVVPMNVQTTPSPSVLPKAEELPIYTPKEPKVQKEVVKFEDGDRVCHAKYGTGVVERVMQYGKKTLCCINFEHTGRKLLDPTLTKIEKVI